jgi:dipeptidyl aminopeptidase/acylaminoacyl peptidase
MLNSFRILLSLVVSLGLAANARADAPPVPDHVARLITTLFGRPAFEGIALSPGGTHLAFIREAEGHKVLATIDLRNKEVHAAAGWWKQNVVAFYWCGPETLLFQVGRDDVNHYEGLFLSDPKFQNIRGVPVRGKVLVAYSVRPNYVFLTNPFPTAEEGGEGFSPLYRLDIEKNRVDVAEENPGRVVHWLADADGRVRYAIRRLKDNSYELLERSADKTAWKEIPFVKDPVPLSLDQTGTFLLLRYRGDDGLLRVGTFNTKSRQFEGAQLSDPTYDVDPNVFIDPKGGVPIGLFYDAARPAALWLDPGYGKIQAYLSAAIPGAVARPWGVAYDGRVLFAVASDTRPLALCLLNLKDGKVSPLLSRHPEAVGRSWAAMREVTFKSRDNHAIHAYLTLPLARKDGQRVPLIALTHGGPRARDDWGFDTQVQFYAALGYGVLQVNYRGSSGYGKEYGLEDIIAINRRSVDDVADGLSWSVEQGYADPRRLVAAGGSYGGYVSMALAERYPELIAAVVGLAGVYDWYEQVLDGRQEAAITVGGHVKFYPSVSAHADEYRELSPVNGAGRVRAPVLLIHGDDDRRVNLDQSLAMADALRKAGKPVQLVSDVVSIHGYPDQESRIGYFQTVAAFLLRTVPPDSRP